MEGDYRIFMADQCLGTVKVTRQGLYYHFDCRCQLTGDVMYRVLVTCGGRTSSLGIPVPEGGAFVLRTRLPAKQLEDGMPRFQLQPKHRAAGDWFVPISPEEPFSYLSRIKDAFLEIREGVLGLTIPGKEEE